MNSERRDTLINSGADGEVRMDALLVLLARTDGSLQDFGNLVGMPVIPDADPESVEVGLESCRLLLLPSLEDDVVKVEDRTSIGTQQSYSHFGRSPRPTFVTFRIF
jgi:hypothetical protein